MAKKMLRARHHTLNTHSYNLNTKKLYNTFSHLLSADVAIEQPLYAANSADRLPHHIL